MGNAFGYKPYRDNFQELIKKTIVVLRDYCGIIEIPDKDLCRYLGMAKTDNIKPMLKEAGLKPIGNQYYKSWRIQK